MEVAQHFGKKIRAIRKHFFGFLAVAKRGNLRLAKLGVFFLPIFFSEMRSWLMDFSGPYISHLIYKSNAMCVSTHFTLG